MELSKPVIDGLSGLGTFICSNLLLILFIRLKAIDFTGASLDENSYKAIVAAACRAAAREGSVSEEEAKLSSMPVF